MNMLKYRNGSTTIQPKLIHSLPKSARISRVGVIQTYVSLRGSCLNFCTADRERGAFRLWFVLDKTRPLKQDLVNVSLSADCKGKLCWCVQIEINSPFPRPSDSFSIRWSIWAFQKMHAAFYWIFPGQPLIDPTFSLWIFYSLHQTMWDAPIFSALTDTCTNYRNILLQGCSYPALILPWSVTRNHRNQGSSWTENWN